LIYFALFNITLNFILIWLLKIRKYCFYNKNILQRDIFLRKIWLYKSDWVIEKIALCFVYFIYLRIDFFYNLSKLLHHSNNKSDDSYKKCNDILILTYFTIDLILIVLFYKFNIFHRTFECIISNYFLWRIAAILFIKLNELLSFQFQRAKFQSFNRSFLTFIFNFIEILISYTVLYSTDYFHIFPEKKSGAMFKTLKIFTDWSVDNIDSLCCSQKVLVMSQIFVFIIMFSGFLTNLANFDFKRGK